MDELQISWHDEHGFLGAFQIRWRIFDESLVPILEMWDDSWLVLTEFSIFFQKLATLCNQQIGIIDLIEILKSSGMVNRFKEAKYSKKTI